MLKDHWIDAAKMLKRASVLLTEAAVDIELGQPVEKKLSEVDSLIFAAEVRTRDREGTATIKLARSSHRNRS